MTPWILLLVPPVLFGVWFIIESFRRRTSSVEAGLRDDIALPHTQEWELFHNDFSLCSKKTRVCLAELGIDYVSHHVDLIETGSYENLAPRFLKVNPGATVPVLLHNGHPIYESHEQIAYAADQAADGPQLIPASSEHRELMERWVLKTSLIGDDPLRAMQEGPGNTAPALSLPIFAAMIEHVRTRNILTGLLFHRMKQRAAFFFVLKQRGLSRLAEMKPLLRILDAARGVMHKHLDDLEQTLSESGGPWITGEQFTLADVGMMAIFDRLREGDWETEFLSDSRPLCRTYWSALKARPSYAEAIAGFAHPAVTQATERIKQQKLDDENFRDAMLGTLD